MARNERGHQRAGQLSDGLQTKQQRQRQPHSKGNHRLEYSTKLSRNLPTDLLGLAQWVCWKREKRTSKRRGEYWTKVPYNALTGGKASTTDSTTWSSFAEAREAYLRGGYDGMGFVFAGEFVGIDLDNCRDAETGEIAAWARPLLAPFAGCYMEASPSGTGVHIIVLGAMPKGGNRTPYGGGVVEMYDTGRFFTMTGDALADAGRDIESRQDAIDALHAELFPKAETRRGTRLVPRPVSLDDQTLLDKARKPSTGAGRDFASLWRGDAGLYGDDDSRADYNLARHLVFWTGADTARIERLMRSSGLAREKWDTKRGNTTYLAYTIEQAILRSPARYYSGLTGDFASEQVAPMSEDASEQETTGATASKSAHECCAQKDKIIAHLQRELKKKQARIAELEAAQRWEKKARANKKVSATTKAVARTLIEFHQRAKPIEGQPNHLRKVWYPEIAKASGVSESTVKTEIDKLNAMGGLETVPVREDSEKQRRRVTRILIAPTPALLEKFETLEDEKHLNHGGDRRCPECGSMHLRIKTRTFYTCVECKHSWEKESAERTQRGNEEEMRARSDAMLAQNDFSGEQVAPENSATHAEDCPITSVQIETGQSSHRETATNPGLNHHDERAKLLALVDAVGLKTKVPIGPGDFVGGTGVAWQTFAAQASNERIDSALQTLRMRAQAYEMAVC